MFLRLSGSETFWRCEQLLNTDVPVEVTPSGITTSVIKRSRNARFPIYVIPSSITTFVICDLYLYHGMSDVDAKSNILPVPEITSTPLFFKVQDKLSPQIPFAIAGVSDSVKWNLEQLISA